MRVLIGLLLLGMSLRADTKTVCASGCTYNNLQTAINAAKPGDELVLNAGETYQGSFVLAYKEGADYITIRSSRWADLPPAGRRVGPEHAALMPKLIPANNWSAAVRVGEEERHLDGAVDFANDTITLSNWPYWNYGFDEGNRISCRAIGGALPGGMTPNTPYYMRNKSGNTFKVAMSPGGATINLLDPGTAVGMRCDLVDNGHHYRLQGLEITTIDGDPTLYNLVEMGQSTENSYEAVPHHIELDRVYIHGRYGQNGPRICVYLNAAFSTIRDSYIADCAQAGYESKGIAMLQSPGPLDIVNNYIHGGSINLLIGGGRPRVEGLINGDRGRIAITRNYFHSPMRYFISSGTGGANAPSGSCTSGALYVRTSDGQRYQCQNGSWTAIACSQGEYYRRTDVTPNNCANGACLSCGASSLFSQVSGPYLTSTFGRKNLYEIKNGKNIYTWGNILENNWPEAQDGYAVWVESQVENDNWLGQYGEGNVFESNIVRNSHWGMRCASSGAYTFEHMNRQLVMRNNLLYKIGVTDHALIRAGDTRPWSFGGECVDCVFDHNTVVASSNLNQGGATFFDTRPMTRFRFSNSIWHYQQYGIADGTGSYACGAIVPKVGSEALINSVGVDDQGTAGSPWSFNCAINTKVIRNTTTLFADKANHNYRLASTSPYSAFCKSGCDYAGTDGKDIGADIDQVEAETSGVATGGFSWFEEAGLDVESIGSTKVIVGYTPPAGSSCSMRVSTAQAMTGLIPDIDPSFGDGRELEARQGNLNEGGRRRFVIGNIAPLTPSTTYYFKITCGTRVLPGEFTTAVESTEAPPEMAVSLAPHSGSGVTKAVLDYGDTPALGTVSSVAGCASGCSLNVPLRQHDVVYWRYRYLDNLDGVKGTGPVRAMVTP